MTDDSQAWWTDGEPGPSTEVDPLAPIPPNFEPGEWWSPGPDAVQNVRGEVGTVGPHHGSEFGIDGNLREVGHVPKRLEHGAIRSLKSTGEVDIADEAIGEREP